MMGRTHVLSGVAAGVATIQFVQPHAPVPGVVWVAAVAVCALLPDLDHPESTLGRRLRPLTDLVAFVSGGHRGATHSLLGLIVVTWLAGLATHLPYVPGFLPYAVATGSVTHVLGDCLTVHGCPLLWPARTRVGLPLFTTGHLAEQALVVPALVLASGWLLIHSIA